MGKRKDKSSHSNAVASTSRRSMGTQERKVRLRTFLERLSLLDSEGATSEEKLGFAEHVIQQVNGMQDEGSMEERVTHPGEGYLASRVIRQCTNLVAWCANGLSGNVNAYDRHELAAHIKENPAFWNVQFPLEVPAVSYLFGAFDAVPPEPRARAPRQRTERQAAAEKKAPTAVDKLSKTEEGAEAIKRVLRFVNKTYQQTGNPLNYFEMVLDPDSFSRTVENVYHVSFLARSGEVAIDLDEQFGLPFITPVAASDSHGGIADENQFIVSLDMKRWKELLEAFDIRKPMMPAKR